MRSTRLRHVLAVVTAAAVLASMTAATVASPASAAKPRCQGKVATIVGTRKADKLVGTAKRDVIVAKGGADRIYGRGGNDLICAGTGNDLVVGGPGADTLWGQLGNDRLHGGPGPDFLAGQVGNDLLNGGLNFDKCFQGTGIGTVANCELPAAAPPPPPPEPPTLVIAYSDANNNHKYDTGDVMIAKIVDTIENGYIDNGDTLKMGQYPTTPFAVTPAAIRNTFEDWRVKSHTVTSVDTNNDPCAVFVTSSGGSHQFWEHGDGCTSSDQYYEYTVDYSDIWDAKNPGSGDYVDYESDSPSKPMSEFYLGGYGKGDDGFIDVEIYVNP